MKRKYNFNPGPAVLPLSILEKIQSEIMDYHNQGFSILESSHRHKNFEVILNQAKEKIKFFWGVKEYQVLFLHGGASSDFFRVPMNLLRFREKADYIETGTWVKKAIKEARYFGEPVTVASSKDQNFSYIPKLKKDDFSSDAKYVYLCSNNTIFGTQYHEYPETVGIPLVADFTSDIFCRQISHEQIKKIGIAFAGIQKNLGPAGLSIVIIRDDVLESCREDIPSMCSYKVMHESNSLYNTCPVFQIYFVNLMLDWMEEKGGIEAIERENRYKAEMLYNTIDEFDFYTGNATVEDRSIMNITWTLPDEKITQRFLQGAEEIDLVGLKGHRSVGGIRASIYNAFPLEGVEILVDYMRKFVRRH